MKLSAMSPCRIVLLDREVPDTELSSVVLNNRRAGVETTQALIRQGFTRIEMISYSMNLSNIREREEGYRFCMTEAGLSDRINIHHLRHDKLGKIDEIVRDAKMRNVEAFVFATNTLAANEAFDIYKTAVAYVRQPIEQFGTEALDLLIKNIEQKDQPINSIRIVLTPEIVESGIPGRETEISQLIEE